MNNFKEKGFIVLKKIISKEIADFCFQYLLLKKQVAYTLFTNNLISPYDQSYGTFEDTQSPGAFSIYGDVAMETLLKTVKFKIEKITNLKLIETYAYARVYKKGNDLKKHTDRFSCEISSTMNLGGNEWPIFITDKNKKTNKVILKPGDNLIYKGSDLPHWRKPFTKEVCGQVFLHYNDVNTKDSEKNKYDSRPHLGLPKF